MNPIGCPDKTQTKLIIDADTVLALEIAHQSLQPVAWGTSQCIQSGGAVQLLQLTLRNGQNIRKPWHFLALENIDCVLICEGSDHNPILYRLPVSGKRLPVQTQPSMN